MKKWEMGQEEFKSENYSLSSLLVAVSDPLSSIIGLLQEEQYIIFDRYLA